MANKFNIGGMMLGWWNEKETSPRNMVVDLVPLAELAEQEGWDISKLYDRIQGFTDAFEMLARNYDLSPKETPMDIDAFRQLQSELQEAMKERMKSQLNYTDEDMEEDTVPVNVLPEQLELPLGA